MFVSLEILKASDMIRIGFRAFVFVSCQTSQDTSPKGLEFILLPEPGSLLDVPNGA